MRRLILALSLFLSADWANADRYAPRSLKSEDCCCNARMQVAGPFLYPNIEHHWMIFSDLQHNVCPGEGRGRPAKGTRWKRTLPQVSQD
ncbi:MAG: hypothetical protein HY067_05205 [Betaproteobacteria bacterium]|nr:hypothetical protein [Betaproteobacteria bacterium]